MEISSSAFKLASGGEKKNMYNLSQILTQQVS